MRRLARLGTTMTRMIRAAAAAASEATILTIARMITAENVEQAGNAAATGQSGAVGMLTGGTGAVITAGIGVSGSDPSTVVSVTGTGVDDLMSEGVQALAETGTGAEERKEADGVTGMAGSEGAAMTSTETEIWASGRTEGRWAEVRWTAVGPTRGTGCDAETATGGQSGAGLPWGRAWAWAWTWAEAIR